MFQALACSSVSNSVSSFILMSMSLYIFSRMLKQESCWQCSLLPASGFYQLRLVVGDPSLAYFMDNLKIFILSLKLDSSVNLGLALYQVLVLEIQSKNILLLFVVSCTLSLVQTHKVPCNFQVGLQFKVHGVLLLPGLQEHLARLAMIVASKAAVGPVVAAVAAVVAADPPRVSCPRCPRPSCAASCGCCP